MIPRDKENSSGKGIWGVEGGRRGGRCPQVESSETATTLHPQKVREHWGKFPYLPESAPWDCISFIQQTFFRHFLCQPLCQAPGIQRPLYSWSSRKCIRIQLLHGGALAQPATLPALYILGFLPISPFPIPLLHSTTTKSHVPFISSMLFTVEWAMPQGMMQMDYSELQGCLR